MPPKVEYDEACFGERRIGLNLKENEEIPNIVTIFFDLGFEKIVEISEFPLWTEFASLTKMISKFILANFIFRLPWLRSQKDTFICLSENVSEKMLKNTIVVMSVVGASKKSLLKN